jgi:hypothetical protein
MKPLRFDRSRIQALLQTAGDRLAGEWLVVGGAAAAAWFSPSRTTEDIDLISLAGTQEARLALMELAADAAIPIEAVNSAADFFVKRIAGWRDQLVELMRGSSAVIYRPSATRGRLCGPSYSLARYHRPRRPRRTQDVAELTGALYIG